MGIAAEIAPHAIINKILEIFNFSMTPLKNVLEFFVSGLIDLISGVSVAGFFVLILLE